MSFRGKGLECPEPPGLDEDDNAGEFFGVVFRELLRLVALLSCSLSVALSRPTTGEVVPDVALVPLELRVIRMTPLPMDEFTGTTTGAAAGAEVDIKEALMAEASGWTIMSGACFAFS
jgi:hypothetical protein